MVRSPLAGKRQNSDETPLNPHSTNLIPEIYSAGKKIYSSTPAYSLDIHHSEIPHDDLDYWARDAASRRLFHRNRCEQCDCDCASDGCDGCLRRNRQCFCTTFVVVITVGVVVLFFSSLSYNLTRQYIPTPEEHHHFSFHHHFYDAKSDNISKIVDKSKYRVSIPIIEDERDPDIFLTELKQYMSENERFNYTRVKRSSGNEGSDLKRNSDSQIRKAIRERQSKFIKVLRELAEIEEELKKQKMRIMQEPRTVFQPFSLAYSTFSPENLRESEGDDFSTTSEPDLISSTVQNLFFSDGAKSRSESLEMFENFSDEKRMSTLGSLENFKDSEDFSRSTKPAPTPSAMENRPSSEFIKSRMESSEESEKLSTAETGENDFSTTTISSLNDFRSSELNDTSDEFRENVSDNKKSATSFFTLTTGPGTERDEYLVRPAESLEKSKEDDGTPKSLEKSNEDDEVPESLEKSKEDDGAPKSLEKSIKDDEVPESLEKSNEDNEAVELLEKSNEDDGIPKSLEKSDEDDGAPKSLEKSIKDDEVPESLEKSNEDKEAVGLLEKSNEDEEASALSERSNEDESSLKNTGVSSSSPTEKESTITPTISNYEDYYKSNEILDESSETNLSNFSKEKLEIITTTESPASITNDDTVDYEKAADEHKMEGMNLGEMKKRRTASLVKKKLINPRIVYGTPEVGLPTGPDFSKLRVIETLKTSQQVSFTPTAMSQYIMPYQICFYPNPSTKGKSTVRDSSGRTIPNPFFYQPPSESLSKDENFVPQQNFFSIHVNNFPNLPPQTQYPNGGSSNMLSDAPHPPQGPQTPPLFCTFLGPPSYQQFSSASGTGENNLKSMQVIKEVEDPIMSSKEVIFSGKRIKCYEGTIACKDELSCIPLNQWCDNKVECQDASDEIYCSCRERVSLAKICDGYFDCPNGEDETGCFDCPRSAFSCDSFDSPKLCVPLNKRCDNVRDCPDGKDETDCSGIFKHIYGNTTYHVSYTSGFLHRNWKGEWLPVCVEAGENIWAKEACFNELGSITGEIEVNHAQVAEHYRGPFIVRKEDGSVQIQEHCKGHIATYIKCPEVSCGTRVITPLESEVEFIDRFKRYVENPSLKMKIPLDDKPFVEAWDTYKDEIKKEYHVDDVYGKISNAAGDRQKRAETGRVVGGKLSKAKAWPWIIALYEDGYFHCGGVILDEKWIMTAAHCVYGYQSHHFEIRAGILRRYSFSPMEQTRTVSDIIIHEKYDQEVMTNDVALLKLERPLYFNRWVRPACLPHMSDGTREALWGPLPGNTCIAVGWGAIKENGLDPDQLMEVEIPILSKCKHVEDILGNEICAGVPQGGKDTCQGDSGGPLLCRDSKTIPSWYTAGIVSHGEGCARPNEPGAYTRVSVYLDWISANTNEFLLPTLKPLAACPGLRCTSGPKRCIGKRNICNGFIDCVDGEDEKNCKVKDRVSSLLGKANFSPNEKVEEIQKPASPEPENISTTESTTVAPISNDKFQCKMIMQSISNEYRCDGIIDCEDAYDEIDCKCKDFLMKTHPEAICDSYVDCKDLSDEEGCIYENPRLALSKNPELYVNSNREPIWEREGNVMKNENGVWKLVCDENEIKPNDVCSQIGLSGYVFYVNNATENCARLYVKCMSRVTNNLDYYKNSEGKYFWPWSSKVYSDGVEICSAVLLEPTEWLMTFGGCAKNVDLTINFLVAELGSRTENSDTTTFIRIDGILPIWHSDMVLFHLATAIYATRTIQPLLLDTVNAIDFEKQKKCVALGRNHLFVEPLNDCDPGYLCYDKTDKNNNCNGTQPWIGVIVCQSDFSWFPASVFQEMKGSCGFEQASFSNVQEKLNLIRSRMKNFTVEKVPELPCDGLRCRTGICLTTDKICNDVFDCPGKEDESEGVCNLKTGCDYMEMTCRNGMECIHKTLYGDGYQDCDDGSDEPDNVTCSDYLKLTAPHRLCDGRRNCLDKTDEIPGICPCTNHSFNCIKSGVCISSDFVCDGEEDCPNGEDETSCVGFKILKEKEVLIHHMSYGVWHSICSPNITKEQAQKICSKLGYKEIDQISEKTETPLFPKLDPFTTITFNNKTKIMIRGSRSFVSLVQGDEPCETVIVKCK